MIAENNNYQLSTNSYALSIPKNLQSAFWKAQEIDISDVLSLHRRLLYTRLFQLFELYKRNGILSVGFVEAVLFDIKNIVTDIVAITKINGMKDYQVNLFTARQALDAAGNLMGIDPELISKAAVESGRHAIGGPQMTELLPCEN